MKIRKIKLLITSMLLSFAFAGCGSDDSVIAEVPVDYSKVSHWLSVSNTGKGVDVFYLYPTAWAKTDSSDPDICDIDNASMLLGSASAFARQATVFEPFTNIYAPYYRQLDLTYVLGLSASELDEAIAGTPTLDAVEAFDYYIKNFNNGAPFILAGHSQGAHVLKHLLSGYLKENPEVYKRMIAAYIIGNPVTKEFLASNTHLKFADGADDTGVIISYNTQAPDVELNPVLSGEIGLVINPISWTRDETTADANDSLGSLMPNDTYEFKYADATVDIAKGVLICTTAKDDTTLYEPIPGVYHSYDIPFYYYNLRENAQNRISKYLEAN